MGDDASSVGTDPEEGRKRIQAWWERYAVVWFWGTLALDAVIVALVCVYAYVVGPEVKTWAEFGDAMAPGAALFSGFALVQASVALFFQQQELTATRDEMFEQTQAQEGAVTAQNRLAEAQEEANELDQTRLTHEIAAVQAQNRLAKAQEDANEVDQRRLRHEEAAVVAQDRLAQAQEAANGLATMSAYIAAGQRILELNKDRQQSPEIEMLIRFAKSAGVPPFARMSMFLRPAEEPRKRAEQMWTEHVRDPKRKPDPRQTDGWQRCKAEYDSFYELVRGWFEEHDAEVAPPSHWWIEREKDHARS